MEEELTINSPIEDIELRYNELCKTTSKIEYLDSWAVAMLRERDWVADLYFRKMFGDTPYPILFPTKTNKNYERD